MIRQIIGRGFVVAALATGVQPSGAAAQWTWTDKAELTFVFTGGNASSNTFGAKNTLAGQGGGTKFLFEAGAVRTESSIRMLVANGTANDFTVTETTESETTAENFFARGRFDLTLSGKAFGFASAGWNRNTFSGIDHRVSFAVGAGSQWVDLEETKFRTDLGATYTIQNNVALGPTDRFAGLRFSGTVERALTENSSFESTLIADENLDDTDDLRADLVSSLSVSMSDRLALKTSFQLQYDNKPSLLDIPLFTGGTATGGTVATELRKVDTTFTVALVINVS